MSAASQCSLNFEYKANFMTFSLKLGDVLGKSDVEVDDVERKFDVVLGGTVSTISLIA